LEMATEGNLHIADLGLRIADLNFEPTAFSAHSSVFIPKLIPVVHLCF
jgi:hypothetical protein